MLAGSMLQSSGNMKVPGILNSLLCLLDVLFNVLFIYGCRMGVAGAALGTGVSELIIASIMLYFCLREKSDPAYPEGRRISSFGGMSEKGDHFIAPL